MTDIDINYEKGLSESDRNARAYGFEIGRGKPLAEKLTELSDNNPFMDSEWQFKMTEWNDAHIREDGNLVAHATRELSLIHNDKKFNDCIINAIRAFAQYGHSGGSAGVGIHILYDLLQYKNLSPLTNDPKEWNEVGPNAWQSSRNSEAFSHDGGKTYYLLSENKDYEHPEVIYDSEVKD